MLIPPLTTKLHILLPRPDLFPRARLSGRLKEAASKKLILDSAPASFDKTTLVKVLLSEAD